MKKTWQSSILLSFLLFFITHDESWAAVDLDCHSGGYQVTFHLPQTPSSEAAGRTYTEMELAQLPSLLIHLFGYENPTPQVIKDHLGFRLSDIRISVSRAADHDPFELRDLPFYYSLVFLANTESSFLSANKERVAAYWCVTANRLDHIFRIMKEELSEDQLGGEAVSSENKRDSLLAFPELTGDLLTRVNETPLAIAKRSKAALQFSASNGLNHALQFLVKTKLPDALFKERNHPITLAREANQTEAVRILTISASIARIKDAVQTIGGHLGGIKTSQEKLEQALKSLSNPPGLKLARSEVTVSQRKPPENAAQPEAKLPQKPAQSALKNEPKPTSEYIKRALAAKARAKEATEARAREEEETRVKSAEQSRLSRIAKTVLEKENLASSSSAAGGRAEVLESPSPETLHSRQVIAQILEKSIKNISPAELGLTLLLESAKLREEYQLAFFTQVLAGSRFEISDQAPVYERAINNLFKDRLGGKLVDAITSLGQSRVVSYILSSENSDFSELKPALQKVMRQLRELPQSPSGGGAAESGRMSPAELSANPILTTQRGSSPDPSAHPYELQVYVTETGKLPFLEWLETLEVATRYRVTEKLQRLAQGDLGCSELIKDGSGAFEIKLHGHGGTRIFCLRDDDKIVLLSGSANHDRQKDTNIHSATTHAKGYLRTRSTQSYILKD